MRSQSSNYYEIRRPSLILAEDETPKHNLFRNLSFRCVEASFRTKTMSICLIPAVSKRWGLRINSCNSDTSQRKPYIHPGRKIQPHQGSRDLSQRSQRKRFLDVSASWAFFHSYGNAVERANKGWTRASHLTWLLSSMCCNLGGGIKKKSNILATTEALFQTVFHWGSNYYAYVLTMMCFLHLVLTSKSELIF